MIAYGTAKRRRWPSTATVVAAVVAMATLPACGERGSGRIVTRSMEVPAFTGVEADDGFDVRIAPGDVDAVEIRVDDNFADRLDVGVDDGTLRIGLDEDVRVSSATLTATVTVRTLETVRVDSGAHIDITEGIAIGALDIDVGGGSRIDGTLDADTVDGHLGGGSAMQLRGTVGELALSVDGGSNFGSAELEVGAADVDVSGGSRAEMQVRETLSAHASGGSTVRYAGDATVLRQDVSGGSTVQHV